MQTLPLLVDVQRAMDNPRLLIAWPWDLPGTLAVFALEYWSNVESHRGTCHKNALIQSKNIRQLNSKNGICIRGSPYRALDTSV